MIEQDFPAAAVVGMGESGERTRPLYGRDVEEIWGLGEHI